MSDIEQRCGLRAYPIWAIILLGLGWAITALGMVFGLLNAIALLAKGGAIPIALTGALASTSASVLFGRLWIVAASAERSERSVHRLRLWARLLWIAGLLLCVSWPCFVLSAALRHLELMRRLGAEEFFHLSIRAYIEQALPAIVLGLVAIGCAEISGRRKLPPDVNDVFS